MIKITDAHRSIAGSMGVLNIEAEYAKLVERMGGMQPTDAQWLGWIKIATKKHAPKDEPAQETIPATDTRAARRARELREAIAEAIRLDPKKEYGIAACDHILANLEKIGKDTKPQARSVVRHEDHAQHDDHETESESDPFAGLGLP